MEAHVRPVNYLTEASKLLGTQKATLAVIDRDLAEMGLRRKGKGRAIPFPTLQEDILLMLAVASRAPVRKAARAGYEWGCLWHEGVVNSMLFMDSLEVICGEIASGAVSADVRVVLNITQGVAYIDYAEEDRASLMFGRFRQNEPTPGIEVEAKVSGRVLATFAFEKREAE